MNQPSPAIVTQSAAKRLPRWALVMFCLAYVLPGFFGRMPWKRDDLSSFGYMTELAHGLSSWLAPTLAGLPTEGDALLPYWLGAWAIQWTPAFVPSDLAARLPFVILLIVTLASTWYATYYLARNPRAQPVSFAFGGEALPTDYARAIADGGVLALIACLGLAQLAHETTPAQVQLCLTALLFYATAALAYRVWVPAICASLALVGLNLSGAPFMALIFGLGASAIHLITDATQDDQTSQRRGRALGLLGLTLGAAALAFPLNLWHWRINLPTASLQEWQSIGRLFLWFTWPAWPLALWTLWRWRRQIFNTQLSGLHLWLPICFVAGASVATLTTAAADRSLLLALPALAALAAFALPTLSRSVSALIDWFTLIFFSGCVLIIWVVWLAVQTGFPSQPAANVARLLPGFTTQFSLTALLIAVTASLSWAWLVGWRVGQHRAALWKSVVLPAGGAALSWLLLLTLWLPMLDFARSYAPMVQQVQAIIGSSQPACVAEANLSRSQIAALQFHGDWKIEALHPDSRCPWLIADLAWPNSQAASTHSMTDWEFRGFIAHPAERQTSLILYQRQIAAARSVPAVPGKQ